MAPTTTTQLGDTEHFSGEIAGSESIAQRPVVLATGEALRIRLTSSAELEARLVILGDVSQFAANAGSIDVERDGIGPLYAEIGYPGLAVSSLVDDVDRFAGQMTADPVLGTRQLYDNDPGNEGVVVTESWLVFVAPLAGEYTIAVYGSSSDEDSAGTFDLTMERQELETAGDSAAFDPTQPLSEASYINALLAHQAFLQDEAFFPTEAYMFVGDGSACTDPPGTCVESDGEEMYFGPLPQV